MRKICSVAGCGNLCESSGRTRQGATKYKSTCYKHRGNGRRVKAVKEKRKSPGMRTCSKCGWYGLCHVHRIIPGCEGGEYVAWNVELLCPNCHSAAHGHGEPNQTQFYDDINKSTPNTKITAGELHDRRDGRVKALNHSPEQTLLEM